VEGAGVEGVADDEDALGDGVPLALGVSFDPQAAMTMTATAAVSVAVARRARTRALVFMLVAAPPS
jgi:hypothetical protein